mgnify:CR=1 FL=1
MNFEGYYIDELIELRKQSRLERDWALSDDIRDYLDSKHIFIFDHKEGQEVYHRTTGTRQELIEEIEKDRQAEKRFESWLFSTKSGVSL